MATSPASSVEETRRASLLPVELQMRDKAGDEHEIERALADHLVGDVHVTAPRIPNLGTLHSRILLQHPLPAFQRVWSP